MSLRLTRLEDRSTPAGVGVRDGIVQFAIPIPQGDGLPSRREGTFNPFPDYDRDHYSAGSGDYIAVGSAFGGGPRVQIRKILDNDSTIVTADFFAFEPSFRGGVQVALADLDGDGVPELIAGAATGGGPVVAVFSVDGVEQSRFFAYDSSFRGGVFVVAGDLDGDGRAEIITAPGPGGGPHVRILDEHGTAIDDWMVGDSERRDGFEVLAADFTHDGLVDVGLVFHGSNELIVRDSKTGGLALVSSPPALAGLPTSSVAHYGAGGQFGEEGLVSVGYAGTYIRNDAVFAGLPVLPILAFFDSAVGNPAPPPTTGYRPGQWDPADNTSPRRTAIVEGTIANPYTSQNPLSLPIAFTDSLDVQSLDASPFRVRPIPTGSSIGSPGVGTGTALGPFRDRITGDEYLVTARHIVASPYGGPTSPLIQPGPAEGGVFPDDAVGSVVRSPAIVPGVPYTVDAAAIAPLPGVSLDPVLELFRGVPGFEPSRIHITGTADESALVAGDLLVAIGRGSQIGLGYLLGKQSAPVEINWGYATNPSIDGQWVATGLNFNLSIPGFSGGPVYVVRFDSAGVRLELVGMTVAGNQLTTFITPVSAIANALEADPVY